MINQEEGTIKINEDNGKKSHSVFQTLRLFLNYVTNILMVLIVFICLLFSLQTGNFGAYEWHIVLCVLGYQLLMSQGILVISKYNYWSMYLTRRHRIYSHLILQVLSIVLITIGSVLMFQQKKINFNTIHGILALCALIMSIMSSLDGIILMYARNISNYISSFWLKCGHYILGAAGLICSSASLCYAFKKGSFRKWVENDDNVLIALTSIFTVLVLAEFVIAMRKRLRT
ncbi:uncharacterized protein LOC123698958 [Colias croceus]|uniref:uncharacterized protein LOC123698958 n=1 Tax=Colias crocea TaxID=72248 RepID=UPI001E279E7D|nr:uncharacterized protein LOC123698958 [Colias croceus]